MKSKRKQVNKYKLKQNDDIYRDEDVTQRNSGTKPFQLEKIRNFRRSSGDIGNLQNEMMHRRNASNNLDSEEKDFYLDLIIKKKMLIETQPSSQKLQSQRKSLIYLDYEQDMKSQLSFVKNQIQNTQEEQELDYVPSETLAKVVNQNQLLDLQLKKQSKCESCQVISQTSTNAIFCHKSEENPLNSSPSQQPTLQDELANKYEAELKAEIRYRTNKMLPPYSFTNYKWRSKSQHFQVDKWKEKYGTSNEHNVLKKMQSSGKILNQKLKKQKQEKLIFPKNKFKKTSENYKLPSIPRIEKNNDNNPQIPYKAPLIMKKEAIIIKQENNSQYQLIKHHYHEKGKSSMTPKIRQNEAKDQIMIKKMFSDRIQNQPIRLQDEGYVQDKSLKHQIQPEKKIKKKKSKFPSIQITTFNSTKEEEEEKRKIKLQNLQKITREWRIQPPKKVFLQKMMEEIPQGWEYGESRDSVRSRGVDIYLKNKYEQQLQMKIQQNLLANIESNANLENGINFASQLLIR